VRHVLCMGFGDMRKRWGVILSVAVIAAACGRQDVGPSVSTEPMNVSGAWVGNVITAGVPALMTWTLTQSGTNVAGQTLVLLSTGTVLLNGTFSGTVAGQTLTYTISIASGGIPSQPQCTGQMEGTTTGTGTMPATLTGSLNLRSSSCASPISTTSITMNKGAG